MSTPDTHSPTRAAKRRATKRRPRWAYGTAAALALTSLGIVGAAGQQRAGADPASGVGPITVDDSGHWFEYAGNGEPYFMAGSGGPEGFLYYSDSRKQQIVDQLIDNDVRAVYIHAVRSDGGDGGGDENPFFGNDADNGVDPAVLDEWDQYLSQLDGAGIVTWFHLYDDGARPFGACNPDLPDGEKEFVRTLVERFRGYQHLVWLPTEEHIIKACSNNSIDVEKAKALAAEIRKHDDVHPLGVHHNNGQSNQYLGNDDIDVFSQQICQQTTASIDGVHASGEFGEDVYVMAECHPWHKELLDRNDRSTLRQSFWASVMAGGYVLFYDAWESTDPTEDMLADLGRINAFMDTTRFSETVPADQLAAGDTKWVLGNEFNDVYIAYSNTNPSSMGISGVSAGTYDLAWFDTVTGQRVEQTVTVGNGTATFPVPNQIGSEVALSVEPSDGTPPVTDPPVTVPPVTDPPVTDPPVTDPPVTDPPATDPPVTPGATVELTATDDAFLQNGTRINNDQLRVEHGNRERVSYVRFDTSSVDAADSVRFELTVGNDAGNGTLSVSLGQGGDWTDETLTAGNAPGAGALLATASGPYIQGQQLTFDLPTGIVGGDVVDLVITTDGTGSDDVSFTAVEGGDGPALVVDISGDTTPPDTTPPVTTPPVTTPPDTAPQNPDVATVTFTGTSDVVANPERGFHKGMSVTDSSGGSTTSIGQLSSYYEAGFRLARMYIRLDDYRNSDIPNSLIDNLDEAFANARAAGIKLIPRFAYNFGTAPDASIERIEQHIDQVTPVLRRNSDVISVLQVGFIGRWGEWNGSTNGLTNPTDRARVRNAVLEALPTDRMTQLRYPSDIIELEPTPLTEAGAFTGSVQSRTGHKNDCFLANEGDAGTYNPLSRKGEFYDYLSTMTEFTVMGGETCQVSAGAQRTACPTALDELELFHWDYLNIDFFGNTIDKWRNDGCFDEIDARLGYRFEMRSAAASEAVAPGGRLALGLGVVNNGFGKLYNPRPINVVLVNEATGASTRVEHSADARSVLPLPGDTATLDLSVNVPADLAEGSYSIHVELPDGSGSLADDPRYSIQMANSGTWRAALGTNDLTLDVNVGGSTPVGPDPVDPDPVDPDPDPQPDPDPAPGERSVLFVRGADRSGGFLEAGSDAGRTEQLADIGNTSTNGGNHGWATLAGVLRGEGFDVTQVTEGAEQSGPTDGQPVDFTSLDLDASDLVVMGSNNAVYTSAQTKAVNGYVERGGSVLFISDANFGGSWQDAPNSDQQFLDRYGIVVHQDAGTYGIDAGEFVTPGHPVLAGVSAFDGEGVSPFDVSGASVDVTVLARAEGNIRLNPGNAQGSTRGSTATDAVSWVADVGDGRIAGHYDRNTFFNDNGAGTDLGRLDNEQYAINLFTWLTDADTTAPPVTTPPVTTPPTTTPPVTTPPVTFPPVTNPPVTTPAAASGVVLVDADSGSIVAPVLVDGSTAVSGSAFGSGQFSAVFDGSVPAGGSVAFELSGPISSTRVENVAPYTLFGDRSGDLDGRDVGPGRYTVTATVHIDGGGQGAVVETVTAGFTIE